MRIKLKQREATAVKDREELLSSILKVLKGKFGKIATILVRKNIQELVKKNPRIIEIIPKEIARSVKKGLKK